MNARQHIDRLWLLFLWLGCMVSTSIASEPQPAYSILPASILRKEALLATDDVGTRKDWRGLVCSDLRCELRSVKLKFLDHTDQRQTQISYRSVKKNMTRGEFTIALIGGTAIGKQNTVPTWFTLRTPRNPNDAVNGSLGVTMRIPTQDEYRLVPRWNPDSPEYIFIYLETAKRRQRIGQVELKALEAEIRPRDILIWAGDLDEDGKVDVITRVGENSGTTGLHLWLSSLAKDDDLVGVAASLDTWTEVEEGE